VTRRAGGGCAPSQVAMSAALVVSGDTGIRPREFRRDIVAAPVMGERREYHRPPCLALRVSLAAASAISCAPVRQALQAATDAKKSRNTISGKPRITAVEIDLNEGREVRSQFARKWNYHFRILVLCSSAPEDAR
jgi:hypothetical protein